MKKIEIKIEVSARHIHLSKKHLEKLFGAGYKLRVARKLSQKGEFAAEEVLTLKNGAWEIGGVRVLGPVRDVTQVELAMTDARRLGIEPPMRVSGDIKGSAGITLVGPAGKVVLRQGVILAARHIHANLAQARQYGVRDGQKVSVRVRGERGLIFENVIVRVAPNYDWRFQVDTDEGNAAGAAAGQGSARGQGAMGEVIKPSWWRR